MKIDIHTHILPESWPNMAKISGYNGWIEMKRGQDGTLNMMHDDGRLFRPVDDRIHSPKARLSDMDRTGVTVQVLSTVPVMFATWAQPEDTAYLCRYLNDHIAGVVAAHPHRFVGIGSIPFQCPELAVEEMKRCKYDLRLAGIEIGTSLSNHNLGSPVFGPIFKAAEDLNMPIFIHPWNMPSGEKMTKYWFPHLVGMPFETTSAILSMIFSGSFERYPNLKMCFAHGAGMLPYTYGRSEHCFHVYPDDMTRDNAYPPSRYMNRIYADTLVHDPDVLQLLTKKLGENHLVLGSDYPFRLGESEPGKIIEATDFTTEMKEKLMFRNAIDFFNLDEKMFS